MKGEAAMANKKALRVSVYTLGCRVNQYESRAISEYLEANGAEIVPFGAECDACIINTCAVTAESERKSRQIIRRASKISPDCAVFVTGCQSQLHPEAASKIDNVVYVGGNAGKLSVAKAVLEYKKSQTAQPVIDNLVFSDEYEEYSVRVPDHTRAYVKIEDGCENKCAYCIIPRVRGPVRSRAPENVICEVKALADLGYKEIVLTGIETCSYQYGLADLIKEIAKIDGIERIRLSSANPSFINKRFTDAIKDVKKFCPHFHLSLQSFCDKTLNAMRRRYNVRMIKENCAYLRENIEGVCFTADMICGFPGETDEDFEQTLQNTKELGLLFAHIFPYSDRPDTEASKMPCKVDDGTKNERCARLREAVSTSQKEILTDILIIKLPSLCSLKRKRTVTFTAIPRILLKQGSKKTISTFADR
jgi:threonylcarbamoyladenosine tRNA methylthiotransferase MtaB